MNLILVCLIFKIIYLAQGSHYWHESNKQIRSVATSLLQPIEESSRQMKSTDKYCEGSCMKSETCKKYKGFPSTKAKCENDQVCCLLLESNCGGASDDKVIHFTSPNYPHFQNTSMECRFHIFLLKNVCSIKLEFLEFKGSRSIRYSNIHKCVKDAVYILNAINGAIEPLCDIDGYSGIFFVDSQKTQPVTILFVMQSDEFKWNIKLTQIDCTEIPQWKNAPKCGRQLVYEPNDDEILNEQWENEETEKLVSELIINGEKTEIHEFSWQANIQVNGQTKCGGSIISQNIILVASHCLMGKAYEPINRIKIVVGDLNYKKAFEVESVVVNFHYKTFDSHKNDIALIKLKEMIDWDLSIQPICLPSQDLEFLEIENIYGFVSGLERSNQTNINKKESETTTNGSQLKKLKVKILSDKDCRILVRKEVERILNRKNLSEKELSDFIVLGSDNSQFCGITTMENSTVCHGDSGSPLVILNEENGRFVQVGIVSYGLGSCNVSRKLPSAYTKVSEFLKFIVIASSF